MKIVLTESQLKNIIDGEIDEKSRSLAFTRKKRLFPEPAKKYAKNRFRFADREPKEKGLSNPQIKK
jgi:hypothetical protein